MALYRNISGVPKRVGYLYGNPMEDMERGDGGGGGYMYPVGPVEVPAPQNPDGAGVDSFQNFPNPVDPIPRIYPEEPILQVQQPNVVNVTTQPQGEINWTGIIAVAGLAFTMITTDGKGWAPWLFAGGCGVLYLEMKKRNSQPVGIQPVRTL